MQVVYIYPIIHAYLNRFYNQVIISHNNLSLTWTYHQLFVDLISKWKGFGILCENYGRQIHE